MKDLQEADCKYSPFHIIMDKGSKVKNNIGI